MKKTPGQADLLGLSLREDESRKALQPCPTGGSCEYTVTPWLMLAERMESSSPFAFSRPVPEPHTHNRDTVVREENNTLAQMILQGDYNL